MYGGILSGESCLLSDINHLHRITRSQTLEVKDIKEQSDSAEQELAEATIVDGRSGLKKDISILKYLR